MNEGPASQSSPNEALEAERLVNFMRESAPRPMSRRSLIRELEIPESQEAEFGQMLAGLLERGELVQTRDRRYGVPDKMNLVVGTLSAHADGYGFVVPRGAIEQPDLYIPGRKRGSAMHADLVVARKERVRRSGRVEGRIIRILERARQHLVGRFEHSGRFGWVVPFDRRLAHDVYVPESEINGAESGKVVNVEITAYPEGTRNPEGRIVEVLGDSDDPRIDVEIVIREHNLPHEFPEEVLREAEAMPRQVAEEDLADRTDFRDLPVVTIDGESAKDFDDAVYVQKLANGNFQLAVHIADVASYVAVGSDIDREAMRRATSVYFPNRVVPMLPERLSNEICSLNPKVDRLVQSVLVEIDSHGRTVNYEFHDGVIRSAERMTYTDVATLLDGGDKELAARYADHADHFKLMAELCEVLRTYRGQRGSIDFDLPEPEILINLRGEVEQIIRAERNQAHRIIEEFMIRANEVVASHLTWEGVDTLYRVHEGPDLDRVDQFREFVAGLGLSLGGSGVPRPMDFQRLVEQLEGEPCERVISYLMLRTMKQARYAPENEGHFGLASQRYTHFTSPIRRYPDLVVHRLLKLDRGSRLQQPFDQSALTVQLGRIADESSERERNAEDAERRYVDWKKVQFMADRVGDSFEGYVTGVHSYGFFVELEEFFVEGLVHCSSLDDDYYQYDERRHRLRGENTGRTFTLGSRVRVQLARVDLERHRLDFAVEEGPLEPLEIKKLEKRRSAPEKEAAGRRGRRSRRRRRKRAASAAPKEAAVEKEEAPAASARKRRRRAKPAAKPAPKPAPKPADDKAAASRAGERKTQPDKPETHDTTGAVKKTKKKAAKKSRGRRASGKKKKKAAETATKKKKKAAQPAADGRKVAKAAGRKKKRAGGRKKATAGRKKKRAGGRKKVTAAGRKKKRAGGRDKTKAAAPKTTKKAKKAPRRRAAAEKAAKSRPRDPGQEPKTAEKTSPRVNPYLTEL